MSDVQTGFKIRLQCMLENILHANNIGSFQKSSTLPPRRKFLLSGGGGETKLFLIIVNVLGRLKGVGGLTSNFLHGGGMDVFWNDLFKKIMHANNITENPASWADLD